MENSYSWHFVKYKMYIKFEFWMFCMYYFNSGDGYHEAEIFLNASVNKIGCMGPFQYKDVVLPVYGFIIMEIAIATVFELRQGPDGLVTQWIPWVLQSWIHESLSSIKWKLVVQLSFYVSMSYWTEYLIEFSTYGMFQRLGAKAKRFSFAF